MTSYNASRGSISTLITGVAVRGFQDSELKKLPTKDVYQCQEDFAASLVVTPNAISSYKDDLEAEKSGAIQVDMERDRT